MSRPRIPNDWFLAAFILTLTPAAISGLLAAVVLVSARNAGNPQWLRTDVSLELEFFGVTGGLAVLILLLRFFAPVTWVDLREDREGRPSWSEDGRRLPNSEIEPDLTREEGRLEEEADAKAFGGLTPFSVMLALLPIILLFRSGMRLTERGVAIWGWALGSFHLFGKDWTGAELAIIAVLIVLLAAVCASGWQRARRLNRR